jgi:site-specific DNA-cytosine methylase
VVDVEELFVRVLVACEFSGVVRDAFRDRGHDAWSCDLLDTEVPGPHYQGDVLRLLECWQLVEREIDLMIAHPPCTYLTRAGDRWYRDSAERLQAAAFVQRLAAAPIPMIAIENPRGALLKLWRREDQVIQPWMFGHGEAKATCLWLKNLPPLMATVVSDGREARVHRMSPGPDRWKERSRTLRGVAEAMADQWGDA